jgi:hypothetical protein
MPNSANVRSGWRKSSFLDMFCLQKGLWLIPAKSRIFWNGTHLLQYIKFGVSFDWLVITADLFWTSPKIVKPIIGLLKNDTKFDWSSKCNEAFEQMKVLLTTTPVLAQPDIEKPFDVYCDASGSGLGCVLMEEG